MDRILRPIPHCLYDRAAGQYRYNALGTFAALLAADHLIPSNLKDDKGVWLDPAFSGPAAPDWETGERLLAEVISLPISWVCLSS